MVYVMKMLLWCWFVSFILILTDYSGDAASSADAPDYSGNETIAYIERELSFINSTCSVTAQSDDGYEFPWISLCDSCSEPQYISDGGSGANLYEFSSSGGSCSISYIGTYLGGYSNAQSYELVSAINALTDGDIIILVVTGTGDGFSSDVFMTLQERLGAAVSSFSYQSTYVLIAEYYSTQYGSQLCESGAYYPEYGSYCEYTFTKSDSAPTPTSEPILSPSTEPTTAGPTLIPTKMPTSIPTLTPIGAPTDTPTVIPTIASTIASTVAPTDTPTLAPTTSKPTVIPTLIPTTSEPTVIPTDAPTVIPTLIPTTSESTVIPTDAPTVIPTLIPTVIPTLIPTVIPTTSKPTVTPTDRPTKIPTVTPTVAPTALGYLQNTDFESDSISGFSYMTPTGWSGAGLVVLIQSGSSPWLSGSNCQSGSYCVGLQNTGSYIYQSLYLPSSYSAKVTFYLTSRRGGLPSMNCTVTYGSVALGTYSSTDSWAQQTVSIPATTGDRNDYLNFTQLTCNTDCTFIMDLVSTTVYLTLEPTVSPTTSTPTTSEPTRMPTVIPTIAPTTSKPTITPTTSKPTIMPTFLGYLQNTDFESNSISDFSYMTPTGWSGAGSIVLIQSGSTDWLNGTSCHSGSYCVGVQNIGSYIYQSLYVPSTYLTTVTFYLTSRRGGFSSIDCTVTYGSVALGTYSSTDSWAQQTVSIPATTGDRSDYLKFTQSTCDTNCTFIMDLVSTTIYSASPTLVPTVSPTTSEPTVTPTVIPTSAPTFIPTASPTRGTCYFYVDSLSYYYNSNSYSNYYVYQTQTGWVNQGFSTAQGMTIAKVSSGSDCGLSYIGTYYGFSVTTWSLFWSTVTPAKSTELIAAIDSLSDGDIVMLSLSDTGSDFSSDVITKLQQRLGATVTSFPYRYVYVLVAQYYSTKTGVNLCEYGPSYYVYSAYCYYYYYTATNQPTALPTYLPTFTPIPTFKPTYHPTSEPSSQPTSSPTSEPSVQPSSQPSSQPTSQPSPEYVSNFPEYAEISNMVVTNGTNSIDITLTVQNYFIRSSGYVYCAAFKTSLATEVITTNMIKNAGSSSIYDLDVRRYISVNVVIGDLDALTNYDVYCYSETSDGVGLELESVRNTKIQAKTLCCRGISFTSNPPYVFGDVSQYSFISDQSKFMFQFSLDSNPGVSVKVVPVLYDTSGNVVGSSDVVMIPSSVAFTAGSKVLSGSFYISAVSTSFSGDYYLALNTTGASADEYYVVNKTVEILSSTAPPPAPILESAVFSGSGSSLLLTFDSETNLANITSVVWDCTLLLTFTGDSRASCIWYSDAIISVQFDVYDPSLSYVSVGDSITLSANVLTAKCCDKCNCTAYDYNDAAVLTIAAPEDSLVPKVNLIFPAEVSSCADSIVIDPSSSVGNMGRSWSSLVWTVNVETTNTTYDIAPLRQYVNQQTDISSSFSIPNDLFPYNGNGTESISLRLELTNYFGKMAVGSGTITLVSNPNTPTLNILGSRFLTINPSEKLSIQSIVSFSSCASGGTPSLSYVWRVYDGGMNLLTHQSKSADKSKFILNPYTLSPLDTYYVQVTVTVISEDGDTASATSDVTVYVDHGDIEAIASGGYKRSDPEDRRIIIDAGNSIDYDYGPSDSAGKLGYSWSCIFGDSSSYGSDCDVFGSISTTSSELDFPANTLSSNHTYLFTFLVSSLYDSTRYDSNTVEITPSVAGSPYVSILSSVSKFNTADKLYLDAQLQATYDVNAVWSIYKSAFSEELQASTPISKFLSASSAISTVSFPLLCSSYTFVEGRTYTLRLTVTATNSAKSSSSYITVVVNSAPTSGTTTVAPLSGDPLDTLFSLKTASWTDDSTDFPLSYSYYFQLSSNLDPLIISKRGYVPSVSFTLPYALETEAYNIDLIVYVFDIFDAAAESVVNVTMTYAAMSLDDIGSKVGDSLASAFSSGNSDGALLVMNSLSSSINGVNCTLAPDCATMNRDSCLLTPQTCGSCKSGYLGVIGDSNIPCVDAAAVTGPVGANCTANSDCLYNYCSNGYCEYPTLTCPSNDHNYTCSGHGLCLYSDINDNALASCTIQDTTCQSYCTCDSGYSGLDCSLSDDDALKRDALRNVVCSGLVTIYESQDDSAELLDLLVSSMNNGYDPHEVITAETAAVCNAVLDAIQSMMLRGYVTDTTSPVVTSVADGISSFIDGSVITKRKNSDNRRRNLAQSVETNTTSISNAMDGLVSALGNIMVEGEQPIQLMSPNFRLKMIKELMSDHAANASYTLAPPVSDSEAAYGSSQPSIIFENITALASLCGFGSGYAEISMTKYGSNPYDSGNASVVSSMLTVGAAAGSSSVSYEVDYSTPLYYLVMPFATAQDFNLSLVDAVVAGNEYLLSNVTLPACSIYNPTTGIYQSCGNCNISTFTNYNVTFACYDPSDICPTGSRRRLFDGLDQYRVLASNDDGTVSATDRAASQYSALLKAILEELKQVMSANPFAINLEDAIAVLSFIGTITIILLVGCSYFHSKDRKERAEMIEERRLLGTKSVKSKKFIRGAFPDEVFENENFVIRCAKTLLNEHSLSVFFFSSSSMISSRLVKWLELWYGVLSTLFVDSVFYGVFYADTGVCELCPDELTCLALQNQIFSTNQCQWTPPADPATALGTCSMLPPPEDVVFFTILSVVISIIGTFFAVIYKFCAIYVMSKRPDWGRYPLLFDTKKSIFYDPFEIDTEMSGDGKAKVVAIVSLDKDTHKLSASEIDAYSLDTYLDMLSPNEEAFALLDSIQAELRRIRSVDVEASDARQTASNEEPFSLLRKLVKLNPDGTLAPLSLLHRLMYGDAFNKLVCKIKKIRRESIRLKAMIDRIDKTNLPDKEYTLLQHFILTNCSFTSRVIVDKLMFDRDEALPPKIDPILWLVSIFVLYGVLFYCIYFIFMWGVQNKGVTLNSWMINAGISFVQDTFVTEPLSIIFLFVFVFDVAKIELKGIYHAINSCMMKYSKETVPSKSVGLNKTTQNLITNSIIQIITPACRVARTESCKYLSFSFVLQWLKDDDMASVIGYHKSKFRADGLFGIIVGIVMVVFLGAIVGPDTILGTMIPSIVGGLTVAFVFLYEHLEGFIAAIVILGSLFILRYFVIQPLYHRGKIVERNRRNRKKDAYYQDMRKKLVDGKGKAKSIRAPLTTQQSSTLQHSQSVFDMLLGDEMEQPKTEEKWNKSQQTTKKQSTDLLDSLGLMVFQLYTVLHCRCKIKAIDANRKKEFSLTPIDDSPQAQQQRDRVKFMGRYDKDRVSELINFYWFHMKKCEHDDDPDSSLPVVTSLEYLNNAVSKKYIYVYEYQRMNPNNERTKRSVDLSYSSQWLRPDDPKPYTWDGGDSTKFETPVLKDGWQYAPDTTWVVDKALPLSKYGWVFGQSFDDFKALHHALKYDKRLREIKIKSGPVRMRRWQRLAILSQQSVAIRREYRENANSRDYEVSGTKVSTSQPSWYTDSSHSENYSSDPENGTRIPVATLDWFDSEEEKDEGEEFHNSVYKTKLK